MLRITLISLLAVSVVVQLILFVLLLRAGWQKDYQKQARTSWWFSITFAIILVLIILNPVASNGSRLFTLIPLTLIALSILLQRRHVKNLSHPGAGRRK